MHSFNTFIVIYHIKQSMLCFIPVFGQHFVIVIDNTERITEIQNNFSHHILVPFPDSPFLVLQIAFISGILFVREKGYGLL